MVAGSSTPSLHFEIVANAFHVGDIASALVTSVPPDWTIEDALAAIAEDSASHPDNFFCLVRSATQILGYFAADFVFDEPHEKYDGPPSGLVGDYCTQIHPDQIVSTEMPLVELLPLFTQHHFFFVLTGNDLLHVVSFLDIDALPVKLCLFTLIIGFEQELLRIFTHQPQQIEAYLRLLPPDRRRAAEALAQQKRSLGRSRLERVLLATNFIDKVTIVLRSPEVLSQMPFPSKRKATQYFNQLHELRNQIAHSDSLRAVLSKPEELAAFLTQFRQLMNSVEAITASPAE